MHKQAGFIFFFRVFIYLPNDTISLMLIAGNLYPMINTRSVCLYLNSSAMVDRYSIYICPSLYTRSVAAIFRALRVPEYYSVQFIYIPFSFESFSPRKLIKSSRAHTQVQ